MSFPRYPNYKDSGVEWLGDVPQHWEVKPVKNLASIVNGYPFDSVLFDVAEGFPLIRIRDLNKHEAETFYKGEFVENAAITSDDVLIGMDGDFNVGRWRGDERALLNQRMCCVRGKSYIITRLLEYALPIRLKAINDVTYATTVKHLASSQVEKTFIAIPPDTIEQTTIAAFLDRETGKIDALVAEQRRLMELLKEKRSAVISHAVTKGLNSNAPMKPSGIAWLGDVPAHWEVMSLRRCASSVQTGGTPSTEPPSTDLEKGLVWFTPGDFSDSLFLTTSTRKISSEVVASGEAKVFPPRSVLIVSIGATLGKVGFAEEASSANQQINAVIPNERIDGYFLAYSLLVKAEVMRFLSNASTIGIMNQEKTKDIWVAVPPTGEQLSISAILDTETAKLDTLTAETQCAINLLQERRTALISAAVTGQIDVRGLAPA